MLRQENEKLKKRIKQAELIIDTQKNLSDSRIALETQEERDRLMEATEALYKYLDTAAA